MYFEKERVKLKQTYIHFYRFYHERIFGKYSKNIDSDSIKCFRRREYQRTPGKCGKNHDILVL